MTKKMVAVLLLAIIFSIFLASAVLADGQDPAGVSYGTANDITAADAGHPTQQEIITQVAKNKIGINYVWVMLTAFLIFFFQAGFALVETGFTQAKNALHTIGMNLMVFVVGTIGFFLTGFAFMFGNAGGFATLGGPQVLNSGLSLNGWNLLGLKGFLLSGAAYDASIYAMFFFQMVFMDTTVTIPTGAMAERVKFLAVVIASFFISMFYYPIYGGWVWGGGWLAQLGAKLGLGNGAVDFAGSGVVHAMGGMLALAGAIIIGPRIGKFKNDGTPVNIPGHDIPMAVLGTIILFFGWFAFNAGSTLNGTDFRLAVVATNTMIAGAVGGFTAMVYMWIKTGKPNIAMTCNGALAGLVAITAPCAFVNGVSAFIIGLVAGVLVCVSVDAVEKLKIDDPVGAFSVHGANGIWGLISVGLFADGTYGAGLNGVSSAVTGLFYGGGFGQLAAQLIDVAVVIIYGFGLAYLFFKVLDTVIGLRVNAEHEISGLDLPEMGALAYADFQLVPSLHATGSSRKKSSFESSDSERKLAVEA
ncbi:MAG: ammonium transporter [Tepidanaerobacteraceae bacterium]|jgi:Amt family ammonium transporter|nr:ammonium transporter [Tepidanaerobacteraceae bacterium]